MISSSNNPGIQSSNTYGNLNLLKAQIAQHQNAIVQLQQGTGTDPAVLAELQDHEDRIAAIEIIDPNQNLKITALENKDIVHETRMTSIETMNTTQNTALVDLQNKDVVHETRMTAIELVNTTQGTQISALQAKDVVHETRMTAIETAQNTDSGVYEPLSIYGGAFGLASYNGTNRTVSTFGELNTALAAAVSGDIITLAQPIDCGAATVNINKTLKITAQSPSYYLMSSGVNTLEISASYVYLTSMLTVINTNISTANARAIRMTSRYMWFKSEAKVQCAVGGYYCQGSFSISGPIQFNYGPAWVSARIAVQTAYIDGLSEIYNVYLSTTALMPIVPSHWTTYLTFLDILTPGLIDARLQIYNNTIDPVSFPNGIALMMNMQTFSKTVNTGKPSLYICGNNVKTWNEANGCDYIIGVPNGQQLSLDFFNHIIFKNNISRSEYKLLRGMLRISAINDASQVFRPTRFYEDGNKFTAQCILDPTNFKSLTTYGILMASSLQWSAESLQNNNDKTPYKNIEVLNQDDKYELSQEISGPSQWVIDVKAKFLGANTFEVQNYTDLKNALTNSKAYDKIVFKQNVLQTINETIQINKPLRFSSDSGATFTSSNTLSVFTSGSYNCDIWFDNTIKFDFASSASASSYAVSMQAMNGGFIWESEIVNFKGSLFRVNNYFDLSGKWNYTNALANSIIQIDALYYYPSVIHDVVYKHDKFGTGLDGNAQFIKFLSTNYVYKANLYIMNCDTYDNGQNYKLYSFLTGQFTSASGNAVKQWSMAIINNRFACTQYDVRFTLGQAINMNQFNKFIVKNNISYSQPALYSGLINIYNQSVIRSLMYCDLTIDGNTVLASTLNSTVIGLYDKFFVLEGFWDTTYNPFDQLRGNQRDVQTLRATNNTFTTQIAALDDRIDLIEEEYIKIGNIESIWNQNAQQRYFKASIMTSQNIYHTYIQILCNGQLIMDIPHVSIPNITQISPVPTIANVGEVFAYLWIKSQRHIYAQVIEQGPNQFTQNDSGIEFDTSTNPLVQYDKTKDVIFPYFVIDQTPQRMVKEPLFNTVEMFRNNTGIKRGYCSTKISGVGTFRNCSAMTDYALEASVAIPQQMFQDCVKITQYKNDPVPLSIGQQAFYNCNQMTGNVDLSNVNGSIGASAFQNTKMTSLVLHEGQSLVQQSFQVNHYLTDVSVMYNGGASAFVLDYGSFAQCEKLKTFTIATPSKLKVIPAYCFNGCTAFKPANTLFAYVESFADHALFGCTAMTGNLYMGYYNPCTYHQMALIGVDPSIMYYNTLPTNPIPCCQGMQKLTSLMYRSSQDPPTANLPANNFISNWLLTNHGAEGTSGMVDFRYVAGSIGDYCFKDCIAVKAFKFHPSVSFGVYVMQNCRPDFIYFDGNRTIVPQNFIDWGLPSYVSYQIYPTYVSFVWF